MAASEATAPPQAPEESKGGRKRLLVLVLVAVVIIAAVGIGAVLLLGSPPTPPPAGATLDHVTLAVQGGLTALDPSSSVAVGATAIDSKGFDETANATFTWSASPSSAVRITHPGVASSALVTGLGPGAVTLTANATWSGTSKSGSTSLTINALHFYITSNNNHPTIGSPFLLTLRVARADNTTDATFNGILHFTSTDPTAYLPADTLISPADAGLRTFPNVIVNASGATTITATNATYSVTGSVTVTGNHPPVAAFTATPSSSDPATITLDASGSSDPDATNTLSYLWTYGDGNTGQTTNPVSTHTYTQTGPVTITLTAQDNYGASSTVSHGINVHSRPVAAFQVNSEATNSTATGIQVEFDATASTGGDGTLVSFAWTFGDGKSATVAVGVTFHNYSLSYDSQSVTVSLTVTNNYTLTNATSKSVPISSTALPPVAAFQFTIDNYTRIVSVDGSGSGTPTGQPIVYYNWTWGDGSPYTNTTSKTATHAYASDNSFTITLTVVNSLNAVGSVSHTAVVHLVGSPPSAAFTYAKNGMSVLVNASQTTDLNGNLAWFTWTWGDGSPSATYPATQLTAAHRYSAANLYLITLVANDTTDLHSAPATRYVSVSSSTLDYSFYDFFNVPFGEWWDMRTGTYGDEPIRAWCFNQTSINDGICSPGTGQNIPNAYTSPPYTDWYPQPSGSGSNSWSQNGNDPLIYAPYRFDVVGTNQTGYNTSEPVFLPVLNYAVQPTANSYVDFNWNMQYLDFATGQYVNNVLGCPLFGGFHNSDDGFMVRSVVDLTMDEKEAARIFGAPDSTDAATLNAFWSAQSQPCNAGRSYPSPLDTSVQNWYNNVANGKYDIYSSFQAAYSPFYTNITGRVDPTTLRTYVHLDFASWGNDVLMARMFYWGNTSYAANYLNSAAARGWWGMELAWMEDFHFLGALTPSSMDFHLNTVMNYHFNQLSAPGPDGTLRDAAHPSDNDDVPYWTWGAWLTDYLPGTKSHVSEIDRYSSPHSTAHGYVHSTPGTGTWIYGVNSTYEFVPLSWSPKAGEQWHFDFPAGNVPFYNPNTSPQPANPQSTDYQFSLTPLALWATKPGSSGWGSDVEVWNGTAWTWDVFGSASPPTTWPCGCADNQYPIRPWGAIIFSPQGWSGGLGPAPGSVAAVLAVPPASGAWAAPATGSWATTAIASPEVLDLRTSPRRR